MVSGVNGGVLDGGGDRRREGAVLGVNGRRRTLPKRLCGGLVLSCRTAYTFSRANTDEPQGFAGSPPVVFSMYCKMCDYSGK